MTNTATTVTKTVSKYSPDRIRVMGRLYLPREFVGKTVTVTIIPEQDKE